MDIIVDQLVFPVAGVLAHQIGTAEFIVTVDQGDGPSQFGRHMKGHGRLSRSRHTGKMDGITGYQIGQGPLRDLLYIG